MVQLFELECVQPRCDLRRLDDPFRRRPIHQRRCDGDPQLVEVQVVVPAVVREETDLIVSQAKRLPEPGRPTERPSVCQDLRSRTSLPADRRGRADWRGGEGTDRKTRKGNGVFRRVERGGDEEAWVA